MTLLRAKAGERGAISNDPRTTGINQNPLGQIRAQRGSTQLHSTAPLLPLFLSLLTDPKTILSLTVSIWSFPLSFPQSSINR